MKIILQFSLLILLLFSVQAQDDQKSIPPDNCEGNSVRLDGLRDKWRESRVLNEKSVVILIARLGDGEFDDQLNQRRFFTISKYLNLTDEEVVTGQGGKIKGLGVIEIYINGILVESLTVKKCQDLRVGVCDNDPEDNQRYQMPKSKRKIKCL